MRFPQAAAPKFGPNTATPIPPEVAPPEAREPVGLWNQKLDLIVRNPALLSFHKLFFYIQFVYFQNLRKSFSLPKLISTLISGISL
jgi:hypothetical protein